MVKSETRRDTEILVGNPSPRLFGKNFRDSKKVKTNHANETSRLIKNSSEISISCQNFQRPTFFEVPFATPNDFVEWHATRLEKWHNFAGCNKCRMI